MAQVQVVALVAQVVAQAAQVVALAAQVVAQAAQVLVHLPIYPSPSLKTLNLITRVILVLLSNQVNVIKTLSHQILMVNAQKVL